MHKLLSHPVNGNANAEVLSLEEILAEGASQLTSDRKPAPRSQQVKKNDSIIFFYRFYKSNIVHKQGTTGSAPGVSDPAPGRTGSNAGSNAGSSGSSGSSGGGSSSGSEKLQVVKLNKGQIKALQEAMYHSAENAHLGKLGPPSNVWLKFKKHKKKHWIDLTMNCSAAQETNKHNFLLYMANSITMGLQLSWFLIVDCVMVQI